jgi:spermidine synthase
VKHGSQTFLPPARRKEPTTYYGPDSGAGLALRLCCEGPKRVGVVGLGAGTLAAYGRRGDEFRFYEINPQVTQLANSLFTFLRESPARIEVTPGDARLSLEREPAQVFDVLAVDAFSGDAIPVHLLTREAFALYLRHLKPTGIIALHISNQYLDLAPVAQQIASSHGYPAVSVHSAGDSERSLSQATWVLATRNEAFLARPEIRRAARPIRTQPALRVWTDDYNNLFQVIKTFQADAAE